MNLQRDLKIELEETKNRFFVFLQKLEAKMKELYDASLPELKELKETDEDINKRNFLKFKSGILGQFEGIRSKAEEVEEEKIEAIYLAYSSEVKIPSNEYNILKEFRTVCSNRFDGFINKLEKYQEKIDAIEVATEEDLEKQYAEVLEEFEQNKKAFKCQQCGSPIEIEKIFVLPKYISCSACQTQNTFYPGTKTKMLQYFAKSLAEERMKHLYKSGKPEQQRAYYTAVHEEWEKLVPDFKEHIQKMLKTQLENI